MNVQLKRYGIVIKSIPVTGEKASIGSGADCAIVIDDPYLSSHVGDLVERGESWFIVDAGTSLEGIKRGDDRVEDEEVTHGSAYSIGGFELVIDMPERAAAAPAASAIPGTMMDTPMPQIPGTMMDTPMPQIPGTMMETPLPRGNVSQAHREAPASPQGGDGLVRPQAAAPAQAAPANRSRRIILLAAVFAMGMLLLLLLVVKGSRKKPGPESAAATATAVKPAVAATTNAAKPAVAKTPQQMLADLEYENALTAWEAQLGKGDDPALRQRYGDLALEVGRLYAASNSPKAKGFFERAVKFGAPDSAAVAEAKRRMEN